MNYQAQRAAQGVKLSVHDALVLYRCWNTEKINKELREEVVGITREAGDWNKWIDMIYEKHLDAAKDDWRKIKSKETANEY